MAINNVYDFVDSSSDPDTDLGQFSAWSGFNPIAAGNIAGEYLGLSNGKATDAALGALSEIQKMADSVSSENRGLYSDYWKQIQDAYGTNANKYSDALKAYEDAVNAAAGNTYSYDTDISEFYSPYAAQRKQQAMDAITNSAANAGNMFSSDYLNQLAAKQQALASEEWEKAFERQQSDRQNDISEWKANAEQRQNDITNQGNVVSLYGSDRDAYNSAYSDYISNLASQNNADLSTAADIASKKAELTANRTSGNAGILGLASNIIGAFL